MKTQIKALLLSPIVADILKRKSTEKQDVRTLQHILFELGFGRELDWKKFGADGVYGTGTSAAVKAFAAKNGIDTDGESVTPSIGATIVLRFDTLPDLRELKKIFDKNQTSTVLTRGSRHKGSIQSLQRLLHALGFGEFMNWEQFGADGIYGNGTAAAVRAFAEKENIPTDGNRMDWELAARMLNRFTPFLGTDWNAPETTMPLMPVQPRGPKSQYRSLFPVVNRNTDEVQRILDPHYEFQKLAHEIPGDDFALEHLLVTKKNRDASYYYHENKRKNKIVLHFTAGQITGDIPTLSAKGLHVSTAFLIGRDGTIYKMFPSSGFWSFHLGKGARGGNELISKSAVGIEISNWGPLREDGIGGLVTWSNGHWYCNLDETEAFIRLDEPYRKAAYFAAITPEQYESVILVLRYLSRTLGIPLIFRPKGQRETLFHSHYAAQVFEGICCHTNFRPYGKWDLCEGAFDWEKVIEGANSQHFKPVLTHGEHSRSTSGPKIVSESEMIGELEYLDPGNQDPGIYGKDGPEVNI